LAATDRREIDCGAAESIAAGEGGPLVAGEFSQGLPESGQSFGCGAFVAGADFDAGAEAQVGDKVAVVNVAGATGFLGVVADLGTLLVAAEGLDGNVDVENARRSAPSYTAKRTPHGRQSGNPRQNEAGGDAAGDLAGDPVEAGLFINASDAGTHGIFTDSAFHAKQSGVDAVAANGADVGVAPVAAEDAEQGGAHDVARAAATVAGVVKGQPRRNSSHRPPVWRNWKKKMSWPSRVTGAWSSHSA